MRRQYIEAALGEYSDNPWVIKRDVLAGGKGVVVTENFAEAKQFIQDSIATDGKILLEEFLPGEEASMLVVMDGSGYVCLPPSQITSEFLTAIMDQILGAWVLIVQHL